MGWTTTHRDRGISNQAFFEAEFPIMLRERGKIIDCTTVGGVFYAAVQNSETAKYEPNKVWALIVLTQRAGGWHNFGYKEMDETEGPAQTTCPDRILDLLSPTGHEYASAWRTVCRETSAKIAASKKIKAGTKIKFQRTFTFSNGHEGDTFELVSRNTFRTVGDWSGQVSIPGWRQMSYEVVSA
jgi:hypothetical protein